MIARTAVVRRARALLLLAVPLPALAQGAARIDYRVPATTKTRTLEKEMNGAADAGYRFAAAMGGDTAVGGKEGRGRRQRTSGDPSTGLLTTR